LSTTSQPVPFNWQQVDERLSSILHSKVSEEIRKLINDDVGHIRFQNMHNGNSMTVPSARLQMYRLHDFRTEMLQRTGNLALVMRVMGQTSTKAAMQYQHPDLEHVRSALNVARAKPEQEKRVN